MNMVNKILGFFLIFFIVGFSAQAQTLPVGILDNIEDVYRRDQLIGLDSFRRSFMIRPIALNKGISSSVPTLIALPLVFQQQYNNKYPFGSNDGAMIPARGYQTLLSAGVYASVWHFSIQLRPEFIYAQNKDYASISERKDAVDLISSYTELLKSIDIPERFGDGS
jgi:hypothetical protein